MAAAGGGRTRSHRAGSQEVSGATSQGPGRASKLRILKLPAAPSCRLETQPRSYPHLGPTYAYIAQLHWPRLDRAALARARNDPHRIARVIARRTAHPVHVILAILTGRSDESDGSNGST